MGLYGAVPAPQIPIKSSMLFAVLSGFSRFWPKSDTSDVDVGVHDVDADVGVGVDTRAPTRR